MTAWMLCKEDGPSVAAQVGQSGSASREEHGSARFCFISPSLQYCSVGDELILGQTSGQCMASLVGLSASKGIAGRCSKAFADSCLLV